MELLSKLRTYIKSDEFIKSSDKLYKDTDATFFEERIKLLADSIRDLAIKTGIDQTRVSNKLDSVVLIKLEKGLRSKVLQAIRSTTSTTMSEQMILD